MSPLRSLSFVTCVTLSFSIVSCNSLPDLTQGNESRGGFWNFAKNSPEESPTLRLVSADPSRYLPEGTSVTQREERRPDRRLLASNNRQQKPASLPTAPTTVATDEDDFPPLDPPLLPAFEDSEAFSSDDLEVSLLPPLDEN